jgi:hypothetical protein
VGQYLNGQGYRKKMWHRGFRFGVKCLEKYRPALRLDQSLVYDLNENEINVGALS